jgi:hypothetical protein
MRKISLLVLALGLIPSIAWAQTDDPCYGTGADILTTGKAFSIKWAVAQTASVSSTDPTQVPHRYNGFYLQIDATPEVEVQLTAEVGICPTGSSRPGDKVYQYNSSGVQKGNHTLSLLLWNWAPLLNPDGTPQLNPDGTPKYSTTQRLRGVPTVLPFSANDVAIPTQLGPPLAPSGTRIIKQ